MGLPVEAKAGPQIVGRGDMGPLQKSIPYGHMTTQDGGPCFEVAVQRGNVYGYSDQAGGQNPAGLSASPITGSLYNPLNSGVVGRIWYAGITQTVIAAAAAVQWVAINGTPLTAVTTVTTGTLATAQRNLLTGNPGKPSIQVLTTATLPAPPVALFTLGTLLTGAINLLPAQPPLFRWLNGCLFLQPGCSLSFQSSTITGAAGVFGEWIWEEVPIAQM